MLDPILKEHRMLTLHDIRLLELGEFMYSYKHLLLSIRFKHTFPLNNQTHNNTRNADAFKLPFFRTNTRQFCVSYQGPSLDDDICNSIYFLPLKSVCTRILLTAISSEEELNSFFVIEVYLPLITIFVVCNTITKTKITANIYVCHNFSFINLHNDCHSFTVSSSVHLELIVIAVHV